jgi:hypothetical protein
VVTPVVQEVILLRVHTPEKDTLVMQMPDSETTQWRSRIGDVHGVNTSNNLKLVSPEAFNTNSQPFSVSIT